MHKAERALFDLRRGRALHIVSSDGGPASLVASVEELRPETLDLLTGSGSGQLYLVVTHHRIESLGAGLGGAAPHGNGTGNGRLRTGRPVRLHLKPGTDGERILALASAPGLPPLNGTRLSEAGPTEVAALSLARAGRLLPAVVSVSVDPESAETLDLLVQKGEILQVDIDEIEMLTNRPGILLTHVSEAPVPLEAAEVARFILFRETTGLREHVAILVGERKDWSDPLPVRLHSACLTGDLFGSLRCDCGEQLRLGLQMIAESGGGVLLYLAQEGRSIGLANKLRAYSIQERGLDTVDADCALGFGADERNYDVAIEMLRHLEIGRVELLTNNPEKVRALEEGGVEVAARRSLHGELNRHNLPYVSAKVHRAGHWLGDMVSRPLPSSDPPSK